MESAATQRGHGAPSFEEARVGDAMRAGVITCPPETRLTIVARMMASYHVHSVVVTEAVAEADEPERPWSVISAIDLVRAAGPRADERTAGSVAATDVVTVDPNDTLEHAARLMVEHRAAHLIVVHPQADRPLGMLSTLDIAGILAWDRS